MTELPVFHSLRGGAVEAIRAADLEVKTALAQETARRWQRRTLSLRSPLDRPVPVRPGRPDKPVLTPPTQVKRRSLGSLKGRIALLHSIAHIELNAVDLALDIVARFATEPVPNSFFDGWMRVAFEEIFKRIPRFALQDGAVLHAHGGQTRSLATLPLRLV